MENEIKPEELIFNESFIKYVTKSDKESVDYWTTWQAEHPGSKKEFDKAVSILRVLSKARKAPVPSDKYNSLKNLLESLNLQQVQGRYIRYSFLQSFWFKAACVILLIIISFVVGKQHLPNEQKNLYTQIIVPIGEKAQIRLPDNTQVWINSGSSLKYPVNYGTESREVFLEGEAYFDVTKQNGKLFIVNTKDVRIKVLGTAFNVKSYGLEKTVETTVVRGLVQVESISSVSGAVLVNPNEKATYIKVLKQLAVTSTSKPNQMVEKQVRPIQISKINPETVISWKDQHLIFTDEMFRDMIVKMERWYNIKIEINDTSLLSERYNGKFVHNENIYQVLEAIKLTTPINYKIENDVVTISRP